MTRGLGVILGLMAAIVATAEARPMVLTTQQLDRVVAGSAFVDAAALAGAQGQSAIAVTHTQTTLVHTPFADLGFGTAVTGASACCRDGAQLGARALAFGAGNRRFALRYNLRFGPPGPAHAVSAAIVTVVSSVDGGRLARPGFHAVGSR